MPGGFTPNGSVRWFLEADRTEREIERGNGRYRLEGKDRTEKGYFMKVTIRYPSNAENRQRMIAQLKDQLSRATLENVGALTLYMPVEDEPSGYQPGQGNNPHRSNDLSSPLDPDQWQIYVDWSARKADLPADVQKGWRYPDKSAI